MLTLLSELYFILIVAAIACKDGTFYRLKPTDNGQNTTINELVKRWHWVGTALYLITVIPTIYFIGWWTVIGAFLIRFAFFDILFNYFAGLKLSSFGTTASSDNINVKIFGSKGGFKKMFISTTGLIIINFIYFKYGQ